MKKLTTILAGAVFATGLAAATPAFALDKMTVATPGIPPVFAGTILYVARDAGIFKKYNLYPLRREKS